NKKDKKLLLEWGLEPKGYPTNLIIPQSLEKKYLEMDIEYDQLFSIHPKEINFEEWCYLFGCDQNSEHALILDKILDELKNQSYNIEDMIEKAQELFENDSYAKVVISKLERAKKWGVFSEEAPPLRKIIMPNRINILDISQLGLELGGWSTRSLVVGILARKLLMYRIESRKIEEKEKVYGEDLRSTYKDYVPVTWMLIDEAHQFLPAQGSNAATLPLLQIIKIGREPGVSLVVATQMPYKLNTEAISQADLVIAHRLTAKKDIHALSEIMQTYQRYDLADYFDAMPREKGSAIILDDNSERIYEVRMRPRKSWHAGESAIAIKEQ
ncbi:MAG: ATP-binding protein, partial [Candidatus Nanohaloarchaeota archaeon]|nr:ATP-binding protein [Candidatus Nanohaloarchaeota archaeon]